MKKTLIAILAAVSISFSGGAFSAEPNTPVAISAVEAQELAAMEAPELETVTAGEMDEDTARIVGAVVVIIGFAVGFAAAS